MKDKEIDDIDNAVEDLNEGEQELKKKIEEKFLKIRGWKNWEQYDKIGESSELDKNIREELINICIQQAKSEAIKEIEENLDLLDIELFLEDIIDKKTGKKVEVPKEIKDLWDIYWEHIKEKIKIKLKEMK